ncbi:MAG: aspartate aminotransferase family protein, partial [FCB group bacterium]|nr:aspartate aminotransferase family protein [FCB group bacterium]
MEKLAPVGDVYQAGTLSGNPVSTAAGLATLRELDKAGVYENLKLNTEKLSEGLNSVFSQPGIDVHIASVLGLLTVFFSSKDIVNFQDVTGCDNDKFKRFFQSMLASGIYLPPSPFEAWFLSIKHDDDIIGKTIEAADRAVKTL